jgi:hypothetical protein
LADSVIVQLFFCPSKVSQVQKVGYADVEWRFFEVMRRENGGFLVAEAGKIRFLRSLRSKKSGFIDIFL